MEQKTLSSYELGTYLRARMTVRVFVTVPALGRVQTTRDWVLPKITKRELEDNPSWLVEVDEKVNRILIIGEVQPKCTTTPG